MLELKNICYVVKDSNKEIEILKDISLVVNDKDLVIITGPNGSGKSTLAKIIMGILSPTSGKIIYNGQDITKMNLTQRAKIGFGFAFQQPTTFKGLTVKDLLDIASREENNISTSCDYLSKVGLCAREYINREVNSKLSGGELKRIELALLLAKNSNVNICDEPEAGIDLWSFDALVKLFLEENKTFIVISHQKRLIEIASKVVILRKGKVEKIGSYNELKSDLTNSICERLEEKNNGN